MPDLLLVWRTTQTKYNTGVFITCRLISRHWWQQRLIIIIGPIGKLP